MAIIGYIRVSSAKFDFIAGNPPWVDWKYLPEKYKETLKKICIDKHLFSGDNFTGGINLNICALITNVVANNWLKEEGISLARKSVMSSLNSPASTLL